MSKIAVELDLDREFAASGLRAAPMTGHGSSPHRSERGGGRNKHRKGSGAVRGASGAAGKRTGTGGSGGAGGTKRVWSASPSAGRGRR